MKTMAQAVRKKISSLAIKDEMIPAAFPYPAALLFIYGPSVPISPLFVKSQNIHVPSFI